MTRRNMKRTGLLFFVLAILLLPMGLLDAHGLGTTIEKTEGPYTIDIDIDSLSIRAGDSVRIDMGLFNNEEMVEPDFDSVWVRIQKERKVVFAGPIAKSDLGATGFTAVFPEAGDYELFVRFQREGEGIVETEGEVKVEPGEGGEESFLSFLLTLPLFVGILLGLVAGFVVKSSMGSKRA